MEVIYSFVLRVLGVDTSDSIQIAKVITQFGCYSKYSNRLGVEVIQGQMFGKHLSTIFQFSLTFSWNC